MELINLKGNTWLIPGPVNIGVYVRGNEAVLIDSGNDSSAARKILHLIEDRGWAIKWIINTHFHADHTGGNALIQKRTGCGIAASPKEAPYIDFPEMEPQLLWSGFAPAPIRCKFLQAEPSKVTKLLRPGEQLEDYGLTAIDMSGHAHGQTGVLTPDNVLFISDSVLGEKVLEKYGIPYVADYMKTIARFDELEQMDADIFVPSHGEICSDISPAVQANRKCLDALRNEILEICREPKTRDAILSCLAKNRGLTMNLAQYVLTHSSISAIISSLVDSGSLDCVFGSGTLELISAQS